jgi:signal transduction histidine kinase
MSLCYKSFSHGWLNFWYSISHELRTPLHGILAAAELLADSPLNQSQLSFLSTVQACGTSLVETVNHVLDFTKLSGNTKAGGVENVIAPSRCVGICPNDFSSLTSCLGRVNLTQLVEEAVEGCWIGYRARTDSEIGSVYAPPKDKAGTGGVEPTETVVDIEGREGVR